MENDKRIITVICTGNICRSPMAERLLAHALQAIDEPWADCTVLSAGVAAYVGDHASANSVKALAKVGLDLSDHRSRPLSAELLEVSDVILTMTSDHIHAVNARFPDAGVPIFRFREWMEAADKEISDPYGSDLPCYIETRDQIAEAVPSVIAFLKKTFNT